MSLTPYPTLRLKLTLPQALKVQFLPAVPGSNAQAAADRAEQAAEQAEQAAANAVNATANKVDRTGDTMTGFLTLNADPVATLGAATKQYVDAQIGSSGAPVNAEYITSSLNAVLTNERVLTNTATIAWDFATPGQAKASTIAGGGNVSNSGTPTSGQYAKWVTATTIQGVSPATTLSDIGAQPLDTTLTALAAYNTNGLLTQTAADTFTGRTLTGPAAGITISNGNGVSGNPTLALANDLAALEALAGTNTIYYRSGTDAWSSVTIGSGLTFASGTLSATAAAATVITPRGRLTLATATPVMTTSQAAKTTIFYTPYVGDRLPIYDGTNMVMTQFSEISVATTDTTKNPAAIGASKVNDWFVWSDAGTVRLSHGPDWTNDTTRSAGTALVMVNGIWLNNASITNACAAQRGTYVGTTRSNASSQLDWILGGISNGGTAGFLGLWNTYNRVSAIGRVSDSTATWSAVATTIRPTNGSNNNRISWVAGMAEDTFTATCTSVFSAAAAGSAIVAIGLDTTSSFGPHDTGYQLYPTGSAGSAHNSMMTQTASLGFHFVQGLEWANLASGTWNGDGSSTGLLRTGLTFIMPM